MSNHSAPCCRAPRIRLETHLVAELRAGSRPQRRPAAGLSWTTLRAAGEKRQRTLIATWANMRQESRDVKRDNCHVSRRPLTGGGRSFAWRLIDRATADESTAGPLNNNARWAETWPLLGRWASSKSVIGHMPKYNDVGYTTFTSSTWLKTSVFSNARIVSSYGRDWPGKGGGISS